MMVFVPVPYTDIALCSMTTSHANIGVDDVAVD